MLDGLLSSFEGFRPKYPKIDDEDNNNDAKYL